MVMFRIEVGDDGGHDDDDDDGEGDDGECVCVRVTLKCVEVQAPLSTF